MKQHAHTHKQNCINRSVRSTKTIMQKPFPTSHFFDKGVPWSRNPELPMTHEILHLVVIIHHYHRGKMCPLDSLQRRVAPETTKRGWRTRVPLRPSGTFCSAVCSLGREAREKTRAFLQKRPMANDGHGHWLRIPRLLFRSF